ncbi:MAG: fatty acid cis/trans isomerase [Bdellovibrio sp.]|nr:fatty acid cis/trans isomerase [Bdellovibrio sp.]
MQFIKIIGLCFISLTMGQVTLAETLPEDLYSHKIQPIFDNRCLGCHSCFNAPCQLNLQNFEGFERGANKLNVYDGTRSKSVLPSRLWIDAKTTEEWRGKNFFAVHTSATPEENIFFQMLNLRAKNSASVKKQVHESMVCPANRTEFQALEKGSPELGMPYGLPALHETEMQTIQNWIAKGAPGPTTRTLKSRAEVPDALQQQIKVWEQFLNQGDLKQKLVSRYLYEHLFLAHIYFPESPRDFFRLVRSAKSCSKVDEIATRRPNDDPGMKNFWYCFKKFPGTVVMKTHLPYELSATKLGRVKALFFGTPWELKELPGYQETVAENPFITFQAIPVKARYQFLLDDAKYHVATFIKGPVCNGSMAVNSIQEQFYTFFLDPNSDNMTLSKEYEAKAAKLLVLPGMWGSDVNFSSAPGHLKTLGEYREAYRKLRSDELVKMRPGGYVLQDIWNGDGINPNAVLTIFRHDQNAVVMTGAVGDLSKTVFVLDYPLFERLVYNLVVNFDVYGNMAHQLLTRVYMDMIRTEAEELFLRFLPPEQRLSYRRSWYKGLLASAKMNYIYPPVGSAEPTGIKFTEGTQTKRQMVEKILFYSMNKTVRGPLDPINWRKVAAPESMKLSNVAVGDDREFRKISAIPAKGKTPFARYFPDVAYVMVKGSAKTRVFTLIHNKEHENISWILGESLRMDPNEDTLTLKEGYWASYPNMIFNVAEKDLSSFAAMVKSIQADTGYQALVDKYGVRRQNPHFWESYDVLNKLYLETDPINAGVIDLTRYDL